MPGRVIAFLVFVLLLGLPRPASALKVYWTTNPATAGTEPGGPGWKDAGEHNDGPLPLPTSLPANQPDIWLGFRNDANPVNRKFLHVRFTLTPGNLFTTAYSNPEGFATSDTTQPVELWSGAGGGPNNDENYDLNWEFKTQPRWERLRIARANGGDTGPLFWSNIDAGSMCTDAKWADPLGIFDNSSFDPPSATGPSEEGAGGTPHWKEIWFFPFGPWGPRIRIGGYWEFVAPPSTGSWTASYVYTDPDGNPRPEGGIKFTCTGSGLTTADHFNARFEMDGSPSYQYDVFSRNADTGHSRRYYVRAGILGMPGVSSGVLALIAISTVAAGALFLQRPRVA